MSKIDGVAASAAASGPGSLTSPPSGARESSVDGKTQLHAVEMDRASERIAQLLREPGFGEKNTLMNKAPGPSLLTQQAPHDPAYNGAPRIPQEGEEGGAVDEATTTAAESMALDSQSAGGLEAVDRITVKIADLGNGERLFPPRARLHSLTCMEPPGWNTTSPTISKHGSTVAQRCCLERGGARAQISGAWPVWCVA